MPIRIDDPRPPYVQLAAELREAIKAGEYAPGDRLPSTRRLAEDNGISPMTVQHALRQLKNEGLVVSHQGRGAFVQEPKDGPDEDASTEPKTLEEALEVLAEVRARLDRLEAERRPAEQDVATAPAAETGIDVDP